MRRVLEPEYMDTPEEAAGYQAMDHSAANLAIVERFLELGGGRCRKVVDLGTGPGDIPILLAQKSSIPSITGVDAAEQMLALARPKVQRLGLGGRLGFERADVKALPFADGSFDGVFSNTILHHIPEPVLFLREAGRILAPQGVLCIRDLYRPASEQDAWRLVDLYAARADDYQRTMFFNSFHAALTLDEARQCVRDAGLQRARVAMSSDRHYTIEIGA
jgi:ubiquinone/menaquinone biosynthesis C-methylase UbiE